jgi:hypothetical protein
MIKKTLYTLFTIFYIVVVHSPLALASAVTGLPNLDSNDFYSLQNNTPLYDQDAACSTSGGTTPASPTGPGTLPKIIPEPYNGAFTEGANKHNVAPALIAAIFTEENFTTTPLSQIAQTWAAFPSRHPDPNSGWHTNQYDTEGAFQFIPSTWAEYGNGGDPQNITDAAAGAANYLATNGATLNHTPANWYNAIFDYNHADWYVKAVMAYYNFYNTGATNTTVITTPPTTTTTTSDCGSGGTGGVVDVSCNGSTPAGTTGLSTTRQQIVCVAKQELSLWSSGQLKPGTNAYFKYSDNRPEEWCADFASWVYNQAGDPLGPAGSNGPSWDVPYVGNMIIPPQSASKFTYHPIGGYTPMPGDLAIHGTAHVNIVVAVDGSTVTLVGGDQSGYSFPDNIVSEYPIAISDLADDDPAITGFLSPN